MVELARGYEDLQRKVNKYGYITGDSIRDVSPFREIISAYDLEIPADEELNTVVSRAPGGEDVTLTEIYCETL